jgi:predicted YcjX-like family ATPase
METKLVNYKLPVDLIEQIEGLSTGNKTALVIDLLNQAISLRCIDEGVRLDMYHAAKNHVVDEFKESTPVTIRNLIDGLHI